ncbi:MAG: TIGR03790 family protein [Pirellulales bacterium]
MPGRSRSGCIRLALEPLEPRELLAVDTAWAFSSRMFLASTQAGADDSIAALYSDEGNAGAAPAVLAATPTPATNRAPTGTNKTVATLEDTAYTFNVADFGFTDPDQQWIPSGAASPSTLTESRVLVLYNTASAAGLEIANYYAQIHPGVRVVGINGVNPNSETISADDYLSIIRPQVLAALTATTDLIVTTKGLPLRIQVTQSGVSSYVDAEGVTRSVSNWRPFSSLEAELTTIDRVSMWQMMGDQTYTGLNHWARNPYYWDDASFTHAEFGTRLTARLDGYTVADVKAAIDRAQQAYVGPSNHTDGPYYFLVDNDPSKSYASFMATLPNSVLVPGGYPLVYDNTSAFVGDAPGPILGYDSHGMHQASTPANYLTSSLTAELADGAVFQSWESYNAYSFAGPVGFTNQGQLAQWLQVGGTAGVGHVEEPSATRLSVTNEDRMFRMLLLGYTFAEAAWSGNYQLSFVNTLAGDPLMQWKPLVEGQNSLEAVKISTLPTAGTLTLDGATVTAGQFVAATDIAAGRLRFTPASNAFGTNYATFTFQVQDDGGAISGGSDLDASPNTFIIDVTAVNDAPVAVGNSYTTQEGTTLSVPASGVVANDTDPEGSPLSAVLVSTTTHGALTLNANGSFVYTPAANYAGPDAFTYRAFDGTATSNVATVAINVQDINGPVSIWSNGTVPTVADSGDAKPVELGVKFSSQVDGYITGIKFYKSAANTGVHTASLWTSGGQLLATAAFTNETTSGWQQVDFASPVAITSGTTYVASYHTNTGHYARNTSYFTAPYSSGPIQVPTNGGVYRYGVTSGMPTNSFQASNYWVDVVLSTTPPADTTPPTVTAFSPASGATNVATSATQTVTFSEALDPATVTTSTVFLRNANNVVVPTTIAYNAANKTVTLTPTGALANSATYTIVVQGGADGVKDAAGNALAGDVTSSFTTVAAGSSSASLWPNSTTPAVLDGGDGQSVELGVKFSSHVNGYITGIKFYKSAGNTGVHNASLWTSGGQLLATATFTSESASGWQQVDFASPVAITAGTSYVASYHTNTGHYSRNTSYFSAPYSNGPLQVPVNGGVYRYGNSAFPTSSFQASNYWVDVVLSTTPPADTTPPTVTAFSPASGATNVATSATQTVTFSEALDPATVTTSTVFLRNANNVVVPTTIAYNAANKTVTLTPTGALANSATYTIVVKGGAGGVKDAAGNALAADVTSSFTTVAAGGSLWNAGTTPAVLDGGDGQSVELGVKFSSQVNGYITGIKFYKSAGNTGVHTASLWTASGQLLATATFTSETASGWQQVNFASPLAITAGATYVASYHTNTGHYSLTRSYFSAPYSSGLLQVPVNGGVYRYGNSAFPTSSYQATNYWVDVVFASS